MPSETLVLQRRSFWRSVLLIMVSFPIACFTAALATDIAYAQTANMLWADFSAWLLAAGFGVGFVAAFLGLIDLIINRRSHRARTTWPVVLGAIIVLLVALLDNMVHSRDAWTSVVPLGLALTALLAFLTYMTVWFGSARPVVVNEYSELRP